MPPGSPLRSRSTVEPEAGFSHHESRGADLRVLLFFLHPGFPVLATYSPDHPLWPSSTAPVFAFLLTRFTLYETRQALHKQTNLGANLFLCSASTAAISRLKNKRVINSILALHCLVKRDRQLAPFGAPRTAIKQHFFL